MVNTITCPQCNEEIKIDEALDHKLREQVLASLKDEHQKKIEETHKKATEEALAKAEEENKKKLKNVQLDAFEEAKKTLNEKYSNDMQFLKKQIEEKDNKVNEYRNQELKLREEKSKLEEERKDLEVTVQRRLDEEKKKAEELAVERVSNDYKLKLLEKEQHIENMAKKIEELQKKSNLTSQQVQGEALELNVQRILTEAFLDDDISEVEKFKNGSDIMQLVKSKKGTYCGKILWECKRVNVFKPDFIRKLKEDVLKEEANYGIIVSTTLPKEAIHGMAQVERNIWICSQPLVECLGIILRETLINVAKERWLANHKDGKGDKLVSYFISNQFAQQIQEQSEILRIQREQINNERTSYAKIWANRENQINRQIASMAKVLSTIHNIVGPSMPQIEGFELTALGDGSQEETY